METYGFFAMMARLKWIDRWALMRNCANKRKKYQPAILTLKF